MNKYVLLCGKSATGKDAIMGELLKYSSLNLERLIMYTSRPMRAGEVEGVQYHFRSSEFINQMDKDGLLIEKNTYKLVYGEAIYATAREDESLNKIFITTCAINQYLNFKKEFRPEQLIPMYIHIPTDLLLTRAIDRQRKIGGDVLEYKEICRRFISECDEYDESVFRDIRWFENTDTLDKIVSDITEYIKTRLYLDSIKSSA